MALTTNTTPAINENIPKGLDTGGGYLPEHLSQIGPNGWYSHWHEERMKGKWSSLANDTALILKQAESLRLAPTDKLITQYTQIVAEMHFTLQLEPAVSADVFRLVAPEIREKIQQLRIDLEGGEAKNDELFVRLVDRLEKRFNAYVVSPTESYVSLNESAMDAEWLDARGLSLEGLNRYLNNLRPSGADAGAVFYREPKGAIVKLAEYQPPWSQDASGEAMSYDMMSSTKSVVGLLCFVAASRQLLNLDQPITEILERAQKSFPDGWARITPRHLLNQASGLARNIRYDTGQGIDTLSLHLAVPLENEPGTCVRYSNAGTQLLGFVLDEALKRAGWTDDSPVLGFAKNYLFNPLGMTHTSLATLWDLPQIPLTDRGLQSTACDFALLAKVLLDSGTIMGPDNAPLLLRKDQESLFQPASISLPLSGAKELDQDFTQRDNYANCFYLESNGIATRGTYNTNMDLVFPQGLPRGANGQLSFDKLAASPCLIFVRQQSDAGVHATAGSANLEDLMKNVWRV